MYLGLYICLLCSMLNAFSANFFSSNHQIICLILQLVWYTSFCFFGRGTNKATSLQPWCRWVHVILLRTEDQSEIPAVFQVLTLNWTWFEDLPWKDTNAPGPREVEAVWAGTRGRSVWTTYNSRGMRLHEWPLWRVEEQGWGEASCLGGGRGGSVSGARSYAPFRGLDAPYCTARACSRSFIFSSSRRFMAWIIAISFASFCWFLASKCSLGHISRAIRTGVGRRRVAHQQGGATCHLFLMILCTMSSVVRLFPLSTVRRMPLFFGSCARWEEITTISACMRYVTHANMTR